MRSLEEVARLHLQKIGAKLTKLSQKQADYLGAAYLLFLAWKLWTATAAEPTDARIGSGEGIKLFLGGLVDAGIVQGAGSAAAGTTRGFSALARRMQSGNIRSYAGWLALGAAAVILVTIFGLHPFAH